MVLDIETVLNDFTAVVASVDSNSQLEILMKVQEIINKRVKELQDEDKGQDGKESTTEEGDSKEDGISD